MSNLISGKEAKLAWANNKEVEYMPLNKWNLLGGSTPLSIFDRDDVKFRLKPRTITLNGIEVPEGADTLAGDERTHYFWKHGVGEKGNMIIGVGESLTRYPGWIACEDSADVWLGCVNDDSFKIIWQRETQSEALPFIDDEPKYDPEDIGIAKGYDLDELAKEYKLRDRCDGETDEEYRYMLKHCIDLENYITKETLNDKVASAEVARQSGMFVGTPFSDLPAFNFGAIDDFVESNVEQDNVNQPSHYCSHPSGIECIEITRHHDFAIGNAIKYLWRAGLKDSANEIQDLEKASWYIQDKINQLKKINDQKAK